MRGSITEIAVGGSRGSILAEDGCEFFFDHTSLSAFDNRRLNVGEWVEFEEQHFGTQSRAVNIRPCSPAHSDRLP